MESENEEASPEAERELERRIASRFRLDATNASIARLVYRGYQYKDISGRVGYSVGTVRLRVGQIKAKLLVTGREGIARRVGELVGTGVPTRLLDTNASPRVSAGGSGLEAQHLIRPSDVPILVVERAGIVVIARQLVDGRYSVGRNDDAEVQLAGPYVSRRQVEVRVEGGCCFVLDVSKNGTRRNGKPMNAGAAVPFRTGDTVSFADYTLKLLEPSQQDRPTDTEPRE